MKERRETKDQKRRLLDCLKGLNPSYNTTNKERQQSEESSSPGWRPKNPQKNRCGKVFVGLVNTMPEDLAGGGGIV